MQFCIKDQTDWALFFIQLPTRTFVIHFDVLRICIKRTRLISLAVVVPTWFYHTQVHSKQEQYHQDAWTKISCALPLNFVWKLLYLLAILWSLGLHWNRVSFLRQCKAASAFWSGNIYTTVLRTLFVCYNNRLDLEKMVAASANALGCWNLISNIN